MAHPVVMISAYPMPTPIDLSLLPARLKDETAAALLAQGLALIQSIQSAVADGEPYVQLRREEPGRSVDRAAHGIGPEWDPYDAWVDEYRAPGGGRGWTFHRETLVTAEEAVGGVPFRVRISRSVGPIDFEFPQGYYLHDAPELG